MKAKGHAGICCESQFKIYGFMYNYNAALEIQQAKPEFWAFFLLVN
jgi:hypothetical protein